MRCSYSLPRWLLITVVASIFWSIAGQQPYLRCVLGRHATRGSANSNADQPPYLTVVLPRPTNNSKSGVNHAAVDQLKTHFNGVLAVQTRYKGTVYITESNNVPCSTAECLLSGTTTQPGSRNSNVSRAQMASGSPEIGTNLSHISSSDLYIDESVSVLWRAMPHHHESLGHALLNDAFPLFMVLNDLLGVEPGDLPRRLQVLVGLDNWKAKALPHVLAETITHNTKLLHERLQELQQSNYAGICFRHLVVGDGGYPRATIASLANSAEHEAQAYSVGPSFFSSRNWRAFREYSLQVAGVLHVNGPSASKPLIVLNDKRFRGSHNNLQSDRRMIIDIDKLADDLSAAYPSADVAVVRFRDLSWYDQVRIMSQTSVFITTQGSSAFRWVWLPEGATCIVVGAPEGPEKTVWKSFHELDRWFPLSYVSFHRYHVDIDRTDDYVVHVVPGHWQPPDPAGARLWWLYNADVRVRMERLQAILSPILS